MEYNR